MSPPAVQTRTVLRTQDDVAAHIAAAVTHGPPGTVGAELEWLVVDRSDPLVRPSLARVAAVLPAGLPGGSLLTTEPGGQVELSSQPHVGVGATVRALADDVGVVRAALAADGLVLTGLGTDPVRAPVRLVHSPRYDVMEDFYASCGLPCSVEGPAMMCSSTAVQVSLDAGTRGPGVQSAADRWQRAHAVGPALVAAFACSPLLEGRPTGWRSTRQRFWAHIDPSRTRAPAPHLGPVESLTGLALTAKLMTVRDPDGTCRPAPSGATFGQWLAEGAPTTDDLDYHLTTLFPPVRLRSWYELRYLDGLPDPLWQVAVAVATALLDDDLAADAGRAACAPVEGRWLDAARSATADVELARAATSCLLAAAEALPRLGAPELVPAVLAYAERYPARGRCPADDVLELFLAGTPAVDLLLGRVGVAA